MALHRPAPYSPPQTAPQNQFPTAPSKPLPLPVAPTTPLSVLPDTKIQVIATGFSAPAGLALDKLGNLYVANFFTHTIDRVASDGSKSTFASGVQSQRPNRISNR